MRIVVVGDVLLDVDLAGTAERLSPDGPVPVVDVSTSSTRAGGAGLVARMLVDDGHEVTLVTVISQDERSRQLRDCLTGIRMITAASSAPTPVKSRLLAGGQVVARIDEGCRPAAVPEVSTEMVDALDRADAIIVADYGRQLTANSRLRLALERAGRRVPLVWDPHLSGAAPVRTTTVATPNASEAVALSGQRPGLPGDAAGAAALLRAQWHCAAVAVTLGSAGAVLDIGGADGPIVLPAPEVRVTDTCGAGDRLAASLAVALAEKVPLPVALAQAMNATSRYLAAGAVAALTFPPEQRADELAPDPVRIARETRTSGGVVVATGGCFDLIHAGHARSLAAARRLGDCLIVCLNSDDSTRRLKGPDRPIIAQEDRVDLLLALECVDAVLVFDEDTPERAIRQLRPDVWVKGGDYVAGELPEAAILTEWGGTAITVPYYPARSTSALASRLARVG